MHCWTSYLLWLVITTLGVANLLSACGQKGDLYLSEEHTQRKEKTQH